MEKEENPEYSIVIEYDDFLTRFDLDEILSSIDKIIEEELLDYDDPDYRFLRRRYPFAYWHRDQPELSYIGIAGVSQGSIILTVFASGAVAAYVARRFKRGVDKSLLADQLERSGQLAGDILGAALSRINDWAERYVPKQKELGGKVTKVRAVRKRKSDPNP
jgi:hypothetical protein